MIHSDCILWMIMIDRDVGQIVCPWRDTLDSGLIVIGCDLDCDSDWLLLIVINSDYD